MLSTSRVKRAIRAGIPILTASLILVGGAVASSLFGPGRPPGNPLVVGIGNSANTGTVLRSAATTNLDGYPVFIISGNVAGLYPGGSATLALRVRNPLEASIRVETLTILAFDANSGCSASQLAAGTTLTPLNTVDTITLSPPLVVAPGQTLEATRVPITLLRSAPNACQNATFVLGYGGRATHLDGDNDFDDDSDDTSRPDKS